MYFSLRSKSLQIYNRPFEAPSPEEAMNLIRNVAAQGQDPGFLVNAEDLELVCLGNFDAKKGFDKMKPFLVSDLTKIPMFSELVKKGIEVFKNEVQNVT